MEQAVHFLRKGQSFSDVLDNVDFDAPGKVNSTRPGWTILMYSIPRLLQEECVYKRKREESGPKLLMRPEQKNAAWME